jgi:HK97 family phage prohead protease
MQTTTFTSAVRFVGLGERQVKFIASDATLDRQGDVLVPEGCDLANYKRNPILLWQHRPDSPVARAVSITASSRAVEALAQFPPEGTDETSDRVYKMIKAGVVNAVSVGFNPLEMEPLGRGRGQKYTRWELCEVSFVSIPANPAAVITERSMPEALTEQEAARIRYHQLLAEMEREDPELIRSRARRLLRELQEAGAWR